MWLLRSSKGKERAGQGVGESSKKPSLDDIHPPRTSSSSETSNSEFDTPFHTIKHRRSQFLRLFGRRSISAKPSSESLKTLKSVSSASSLRNAVKAVSGSSPIRSAHRERSTPYLPIELWIYILQLASNSPHPFLCSSALEPPPSSSTSRLDNDDSASPPSQPVSFLDYPNSHLHLVHEYKRMLAFKIQLTSVCKRWHAIGQVVLFEFVWLSNREEADALLKQLDERALTSFEDSEDEEEGKDGEKGKESGMGLREGVVARTRKSKNRKGKKRAGTKTFGWDTRDLGRHIRRIHIETASSPFDRCSSDTILRILEHATGLQAFSDFGSIRRNPRWSVSSVVVGGASGAALTSTLPIPASSSSSASTLAPYSYTTTSTSTTSITSSSEDSTASSTSDLFHSNPSSPSSSTSVSSFPTINSSTDEPLLSALLPSKSASANLRRLSLTSYHHPCSRPSSEATESDIANIYDAGIRYFATVVSPKLELASEKLEFLELTLCAEDMGSGGLLESLVGDGRVGLGLGGGGGWAGEPLSLPALKALKVTLDNATFHVLSTWDMPALVNLSVISADFSYAGDGFREFFEAHGSKLKQLELGHSTEAIEDHFAGSSPFTPHIPHPQVSTANANGTATNTTETSGWSYGGLRVPLAEWCPNLEQFVCSANAEWNWQNPDWIAPHVLLPAHPTLEFIGVWDLEMRIHEGVERCERVDKVGAARGIRPVGIEVRDVEDGSERRESGDEAFFMLTEQFGSLFNREAFPNLKYVRDLSWESGVMRSRGMVCGNLGVASTMGGGDGRGTADVRRDHGMSSVRGFLHEALRPSHHHGPSTDASQPSEQDIREAELARRLAKQQHRRVLRFWMRVLEKCKERGVYLEGCEGLSVTVGELRRVAAGTAGR